VTIVRSDRRDHKPAPKLDEVEQIKRLIEIQKQIVELAKQNELTERECEALRHELSRSARRPANRRLRFTLFHNAVERIKRMLNQRRCSK
jgi:hypothetical protein